MAYNWLLTAAHIFSKQYDEPFAPKYFNLCPMDPRTGEKMKPGVILRLKERSNFFINPKFDTREQWYDVALIDVSKIPPHRLPRPDTFPRIQRRPRRIGPWHPPAVKAPTRYRRRTTREDRRWMARDHAAGTMLRGYGWGTTQHSVMPNTGIPEHRAFPHRLRWFEVNETRCADMDRDESTLCAQGFKLATKGYRQDACGCDSGGPLLRYTASSASLQSPMIGAAFLVGVVSYGPGNLPCGLHRYGVYSRISAESTRTWLSYITSSQVKLCDVSLLGRSVKFVGLHLRFMPPRAFKRFRYRAGLAQDTSMECTVQGTFHKRGVHEVVCAGHGSGPAESTTVPLASSTGQTVEATTASPRTTSWSWTASAPLTTGSSPPVSHVRRLRFRAACEYVFDCCAHGWAAPGQCRCGACLEGFFLDKFRGVCERVARPSSLDLPPKTLIFAEPGLCRCEACIPGYRSDMDGACQG